MDFSACGHELSGHVAYNACGLQSKLQITHLVSEAIILLYCRYGAA